MDELAFSLQCSHGIWRLLLQPVDDCTGQRSDGMAAASMGKHRGLNSVAYSSLLMLYYIACGPGEFGSWDAVFHGHCTRHHPQRSQLPEGGRSFTRASWVHSTGRCLAARDLLLQQASLQREHRDNPTSWIQHLTAGCKGWQSVLGASLGQIALQGHRHCHCHCCH